MFGKNLKYELRASARVLIPLFICVLAVGIFISVGFAVFGNVYFGADNDMGTKASETLSAVGSAVMGLLFVAFSVLIMVTAVAAVVLMVRRFYTSFFTDEAYLTFTLPVSVDCHLATKTVATVIWAIASGVVMFITFVIICFGIVSTVSTVVTAVAMVPLIYAIEDADAAMMITYLISTVLSAAELVGCYFGTRYILTKKINL